MPRVVYTTPSLKIPDGIPPGFERISPMNDLLISGMNGAMYEASRIGNLFYVANQAAVTTSVLFTDIYTGLAISNPKGNNKDIVLRAAGFKLSALPVATAAWGLAGGYHATTAITGTPLVVGTTLATLNLGNTTGPTAQCFDSCTFPASTERMLMPMGGAFTAGALGCDTPNYLDLKSAVILQPGAYAFIATRTAAVGFAFFWWSESPR